MHNSVSLATQEEVGIVTSSTDGFPELNNRWKRGWKKSSSTALRAFLLLFSCALRLDGEQMQLSYTLKKEQLQAMKKDYKWKYPVKVSSYQRVS